MRESSTQRLLPGSLDRLAGPRVHDPLTLRPDTMRRCYLVCYDIRDDRRLRRVHRLMKAYGEPWQYSVFYCTLKPIDRVRLETALRDEINLKVDQVLIVDLGGNEDAVRDAAKVVGQSLPEQESGVVVI